MEGRRKVGLLIPSTDTAMEADLWRHLPADVTLHVARMLMEATTVAAEEKMLTEELEPAARRVGSVMPELVVFGCTSAAALRGIEGDRVISQTVTAITGAPCVTVVQAAVNDIRNRRMRSLLLVTPYVEEINLRLQATFRQAGLPVTGVVGMGLDHDLKIGAVPPTRIREFVLEAVKHAQTAPDGVFVSCTTFRALEVAAQLEQDLGMPVVTSNKAVLRALGERLGIQLSLE